MDTHLPSINKTLLESCIEQGVNVCADFIANNSLEADVLSKFGINLTSIGSHVKAKVDDIDATFLNNASVKAGAIVTGKVTCYCKHESSAYFRCGKKF